MQKNKANILIATAEAAVQEQLASFFRRAGYQYESVTNVEAALDELAARPFDLAFADIRTPGSPLQEFLQQLQEFHPEVVVVVIAAADAVEAASAYVQMGAYDYVTTPFSLEHVLSCTNRALEKKRLEDTNREFQTYLAQMVEERAAATQRLMYGITQVLIRLLELRVPFDVGHAVNVAEISRRIARGLKMTADGVHKVYLAALLHDVGMIPIRDFLIHKHGPLTKEEYRQIQEHTSLAEAVLKPVIDDDEVLRYIRHHHERYDGTGYPDGLKGNIIPLGARIVAVAEAFDSMIRSRPYRKALPSEAALEELQRYADKQFDRKVVGAFLEISEELDTFLRKQYPDES
jgi:response regulator RpfG family c-di-GMP phosphodiesterase